MTILFVFIGSAILVGLITLVLFRLIVNRLGLKKVMEEGVVLTENGLDVLGFFGFGRKRLRYADVESVEILPHNAGPFTPLLLRYRLSARWVGTRLFHEIVVIRLKGPRIIRYLISTPKDGPAFVEQLKSRIESSNLFSKK